MFKPVTTNAVDIKKELGKSRVGTYVGSTPIITKLGPQTIWNFVGEDELPFGIYGFTNLSNVMKTLAIGALCRITYTGTQFVKTKFKTAGQDVHQVLVEVDSEEAPIEGGAPDGENEAA